MKECLNAARLQSYFDGALSVAETSAASAHLALCPGCAAAAREVEAEMLIVASALAVDDSLVVPTERLRERLNAAVAAERIVDYTRPQSFFAGLLGSLFNFQKPLAYGMAGAVLLAVCAGLLVLIHQRTVSDRPETLAARPTENPIPSRPAEDSSAAVTLPDVKPTESKSQLTQSVRYVPATRTAKTSQPATLTPAPRVKLLPGEKSYLKAIVELKAKVENRSEMLRPEVRVAYERNLAVVDQAIAASRMAARHDPRDSDANSLLLSAYQSKVELLSAVAGQTPFEAR